MKSMILLIQLLAGKPDYEPMELVIDIQTPIEQCEWYYIENDKLYDLGIPEYQGSKLVLYVQQYRDYEIVINNHTIISITPMSDDIVDERDLSISAHTNYKFRRGVLVFEPLELTSK